MKWGIFAIRNAVVVTLIVIIKDNMTVSDMAKFQQKVHECYYMKIIYYYYHYYHIVIENYMEREKDVWTICERSWR